MISYVCMMGDEKERKKKGEKGWMDGGWKDRRVRGKGEARVRSGGMLLVSLRWVGGWVDGWMGGRIYKEGVRYNTIQYNTIQYNTIQ